MIELTSQGVSRPECRGVACSPLRTAAAGLNANRRLSGRAFSFLFGTADGVSRRRGLGRYAARVAVVSAAYVGTAKLGLALAYEQSSITAVWAPTGIALAALIIWGYRLWPAVALGAFLANLWTGVPLVTVVGITTGNTLEALVGAYLLLRVAGFQPSLARVRDVLALLVYGAVVSTTVSATIGVASLWLGDATATSDLASDWRLWWLGDMGGDLLVAPLLVVLASPGALSVLRGRLLEVGALVCLLVSSSIVVFSELPLPYSVWPVFVWSALRFCQLGAAATSVILAGIAVAFTASGAGPFVRSSPDENLLLSQGFMYVAGVTALLLAAVTSQREGAIEALERGRDKLEARVKERTSELERSHEELGLALARERDAGERLRELDRLKDEFLATVSHELRTPLTVISALTEVLRGSPDHDDREEWLERIFQNASQMSGMIEQLLDYSRLEAGRVALEIRPLDLRDAAFHCIEVTRQAVGERQIRLEVPDGLMVQADERGFERILVNLLANAAKYSPEGSAIWVTAGTNNGEASIAVRDEGAGIPPAEQGRVFERFYQSSVISGSRGTGIGLSIVRRYVELHSGQVWVESQPGRGSTFVFTLPVSERRERSAV